MTNRQKRLQHSFPDESSIHRIRHGKSFLYRRVGKAVRDQKTLDRIRKLAIPPAYENVLISENSQAHVQAVGWDARGRKQYRYHERWSEKQGQNKFEHMVNFAKAIPKIRKTTRDHLKHPDLNREKTLATVVQLLDKTLIRIGNDEYAKKNHSYGLSTLKCKHVSIQGDEISFQFLGKSKISHSIRLRDRTLAKIVKQCSLIPGYSLFQYKDADGKVHRIHSQDVNSYLHEISGQDFTAKDFRTWNATVLAAQVLSKLEIVETKTLYKQTLNKAIDQVALKLGNTRTICRKSYIHPAILEAYELNKNRLSTLRTNPEIWVVNFLTK